MSVEATNTAAELRAEEFRSASDSNWAELCHIAGWEKPDDGQRHTWGVSSLLSGAFHKV